MLTDLSLNPKLLERALAVSGEASVSALITCALVEFIARREQRSLLEMMGQLEWNPACDFKRERERL